MCNMTAVAWFRRSPDPSPCVYVCMPSTTSLQFTWLDGCPHCILAHGFSGSITLLSSPPSEGFLERSGRFRLIVLPFKKGHVLPVFNHVHLCLLSMFFSQHLRERKEYPSSSVRNGRPKYDKVKKLLSCVCISLVKVIASRNRTPVKQILFSDILYCLCTFPFAPLNIHSLMSAKKTGRDSY